MTEIKIICPDCKAQKPLEIPEALYQENNNTTTISIPKDIVCEHHFQAFIDKQGKVRGYQKIDYTYQQPKEIPSDNDLLENLTAKGNNLSWFPEHLRNLSTSNINTLRVFCPNCNILKTIEIPSQIMVKFGGKPAITLPPYLVCEHTFQMIVDNDFDPVGYHTAKTEEEQKLIEDKEFYQEFEWLMDEEVKKEYLHLTATNIKRVQTLS